MSQETPTAPAEHAAPRPAAKAPSRFRRVALMLLVPVTYGRPLLRYLRG